MARWKKGGIEYGGKRLPEQKPVRDETEESDEEEPKRRKVVLINNIHHVREWIPENDPVSGEPAKENSTIPVKLKEITRLETPEEREERKAAHAEAKRIALEKKLKYWKETPHPTVVIKETHLPSLGKKIKYRVNPNCLLGFLPYERIVISPQVFVSCVELTRKNVSSDKKVYVCVGMLVKLSSSEISPVLLHSIIMRQEAPNR